MACFLVNNYFNVWQKWPGASIFYASLLSDGSVGWQAWLQGLAYPVVAIAAIVITLRRPQRTLMQDSAMWSAVAAYIVRAAFWSVLLIGIIDGIISFLRVEEMLAAVVGETLGDHLGLASFRGTYVHYPLLGVACFVAALNRNISVSWLALLVVLAEFTIVITRFVFSYEQTFMGDLVRFWYAGLYLFASAYTLEKDGHVRVDVLYARLSHTLQARLNMIGTLLLGLPLCWIVLTLGLWERTSSLNSPIVGFEISQSGYGLYAKYLMAGFLIIFATSMMVQFCSYLLMNLAIITGAYEPADDPDETRIEDEV